MSKLGLAAGRPSENRKKQALASMAEENRTVRVNFDLDDEAHMRLKIYAVKSRRSVSEIMRELINKGSPQKTENKAR